MRGALFVRIKSFRWLRAGELPCRTFSRGCGKSLAESRPATHRADALWYHAPNICENVRVERASAGQAVVVASMEPAGYYPCLDNPAFMGMFDLEMSYRMRARTTPRKCCFTGCSLESQAGLT